MKAFLPSMLLAVLLISPSAWAEDASPSAPAPVAAPLPVTPDLAPQTALAAAPEEQQEDHSNYLQNFRQDSDEYVLTSTARGLSPHRPMYLLPYSYSQHYDGSRAEVVFQISGKQRLFGTNFYLGYTQRSFWQMYNKKDSSPFRETVYNPEVFYRWTPKVDWLNKWGADFGFEHESNGRDLPDSRSWNRIYIAPFQSKGKYLVYLKFWYRMPEKEKTSPTDTEGDDNPDIERFMGHAEFQVQRQFFGDHIAHVTLRNNLATGKGAIALNYSIPSNDGSVFFCLNFFNGYGESLLDYNRSVTRVGLGVMVTR